MKGVSMKKTLAKKTFKAKYGGPCESCGLTIKSNEVVVWYPLMRAIRHKMCDDYNAVPPRKKKKR